MNQSQRMIESLRVMEGTSTQIFFDYHKAAQLAGVLQSPVVVSERTLVSQILSDDQLADTFMSWPQDEDIRPAVIMRLAGWLDEGPGKWKEPWDEQARLIIEDLASVAKTVTKIIKMFGIKKKVDWNRRVKTGEDKEFERVVSALAKKVSKDFQINDKGALKFIAKLVDLKLSIGELGA